MSQIWNEFDIIDKTKKSSKLSQICWDWCFLDSCNFLLSSMHTICIGNMVKIFNRRLNECTFVFICFNPFIFESLEDFS